MRRLRRQRPGLTLIELLAALAILAGVVSAGSAWTVTLARSVHSSARATQEFGARARLLAVLRQDLDSAQPQSVSVKEGTLELLTTHRPGAAIPAWRTVRWSFDPARRRLTREDGATKSQQRHRQSIDDIVLDWSAALEEAPRTERVNKSDVLTVRLRFSNPTNTRAETSVLVWRREP
jgi:prepilin-type N-terminal cleavage/methylation domain-containing protein